MTNLTREEAKAALTQHVKDFIETELTKKIDAEIDTLFSSGALPLDEWDGCNLILPRCVTTALLELAADRVIWISNRKKHQNKINNIKKFL